jgi:hypothetical protein
MNTPVANKSNSSPTSKKTTVFNIVTRTLLTAVLVKVTYENAKRLFTSTSSEPQEVPQQEPLTSISEEV